MADTRTIERQAARVLLPPAILLAALVCSLPSTTSFAHTSLREHYPIPVAKIDHMLDADRHLQSGQMLKQGPISPEGTPLCVLIEDQVQVLELTPLVPATALCVGLTASVDAIGWPGYEALGDHARSVGNWSEAEHAYVKAIEWLERTTVKDGNQDLAALLNKLGITRFKQKDFAEAETAYRQALRIYTSTQDAEDLRVAATLHLLAMALFEQHHGRDLAGSLFFRAWAVRQKVLGPEDPAVAESLHLMALSLYPGELSKAVPLLLQAMEIRRKTYGPTHPSVVDTLMAMAVLYEAHHRHDLAIPLYRAALIIQEHALGPNAAETLRVRHRLNMAYRGKGTSAEESKGRE
jgi:hypothetical protein